MEHYVIKAGPYFTKILKNTSTHTSTVLGILHVCIDILESYISINKTSIHTKTK